MRLINRPIKYYPKGLALTKFREKSEKEGLKKSSITGIIMQKRNFLTMLEKTANFAECKKEAGLLTGQSIKKTTI